MESQPQEPAPIVAASVDGLTGPQPPWLEPPFHMTQHLCASDRARINEKRAAKLRMLVQFLMSNNEELPFA